MKKWIFFLKRALKQKTGKIKIQRMKQEETEKETKKMADSWVNMVFQRQDDSVSRRTRSSDKAAEKPSKMRNDD